MQYSEKLSGFWLGAIRKPPVPVPKEKPLLAKIEGSII